MANKIGPTFPAELQAAGLPLNGISWDTANGVFVSTTGWNPTQLAEGEAVLAAHNPNAQTPQQIFASNAATGITVGANATGVPQATFALDMATQTDLVGTASIIAFTGAFPGGASTFTYPDITSTPQTFPSVAAFKSFMVGYTTLVLQMKQALATSAAGGVPAWPSQTVTPT